MSMDNNNLVEVELDENTHNAILALGRDPAEFIVEAIDFYLETTAPVPDGPDVTDLAEMPVDLQGC